LRHPWRLGGSFPLSVFSLSKFRNFKFLFSTFYFLLSAFCISPEVSP
jgi:hypothetical protein